MSNNLKKYLEDKKALMLKDGHDIKAIGDFRFEVVGAPYYGHNEGKDDHGQYFSPNTDFMMDIGEKRPVIYYHGMTPRGANTIKPEVIGKAELIAIDPERGLVFDVALDGDKPLVQRIVDAAKEGLARASSGAINYLVRVAEATGEILTWPLAELSLFDTGAGRQPANQLATVSLKALFDNAGIDYPEAFAEIGEIQAKASDEISGDQKHISTTKENIMSDEQKTLPDAQVDVKSIVSMLKAELKAEADAEAQRKAEIDTAVKAALEDQKSKFDEAISQLGRKGRKTAAFNTRAGKNSKSAGADEFLYWMKTGDNGGERVLKYEDLSGYDEMGGKKALQVGSDTEGGYLVPEDFYGSIVAQRDQIAWTRNVGLDIFQTSLNKVDIPTEATAMTKFSFVAEEAAYSTNDPLFGQVQIQVYKATKLTKVSNELLEDDAAGLDRWYATRLADALALTESYYVAVGSGSSQPTGVFVGGTAGLTFDSAAQIDAPEIPELFYKLGSGYRGNATWLCHQEVEAYMRGIRDANNWAFDYMRPENIGVRGDWKYSTFYGGRPIFNEEGCATIATSAKTLLVGDFRYYTLAEHTGLVVSRNPWLYQANDQVGFFAKARWGGAVTQAGAFQYATQA